MFLERICMGAVYVVHPTTNGGAAEHPHSHPGKNPCEELPRDKVRAAETAAIAETTRIPTYPFRLIPEVVLNVDAEEARQDAWVSTRHCRR